MVYQTLDNLNLEGSGAAAPYDTSLVSSFSQQSLLHFQKLRYSLILVHPCCSHLRFIWSPTCTYYSDSSSSGAAITTNAAVHSHHLLQTKQISEQRSWSYLLCIVDQHLLGDCHWLLLLLLHINDLLSIDGVSIIKSREKETLC